MNSIKEQMIKIITDLPDDSSFDEILQEIDFTAMINNGLQDSINENVISVDDLRKDISKW